jgi:hypothetical protein
MSAEPVIGGAGDGTSSSNSNSSNPLQYSVLSSLLQETAVDSPAKPDRKFSIGDENRGGDNRSKQIDAGGRQAQAHGQIASSERKDKEVTDSMDDEELMDFLLDDNNFG